jgi:hypothetical protein
VSAEPHQVDVAPVPALCLKVRGYGSYLYCTQQAKFETNTKLKLIFKLAFILIFDGINC